MWCGIRRRRSRLWASLGCLVLLGAIGFFIGCGGSSSSSSTDVAKGTYTVTLDGTDTSSSSIASSTTFTVTVD
jgi:hypothetical protein